MITKPKFGIPSGPLHPTRYRLDLWRIPNLLFRWDSRRTGERGFGCGIRTEKSRTTKSFLFEILLVWFFSLPKKDFGLRHSRPDRWSFRGVPHPSHVPTPLQRFTSVESDLRRVSLNSLCLLFPTSLDDRKVDPCTEGWFQFPFGSPRSVWCPEESQ